MGTSLALPTCCWGTSTPSLGVQREGTLNRVLSWWVGQSLGHPDAEAPSGPILPACLGVERAGSGDEQTSGDYVATIAHVSFGGASGHPHPSHPHGGPRGSAPATLIDLKRYLGACGDC